jgi:hypothetical protein
MKESNSKESNLKESNSKELVDGFEMFSIENGIFICFQ